MRNSFMIIVFVLAFISCNQKKNKIIESFNVDSSLSKDCHFFKDKYSDTLKFSRKIIILENTINDTILLGNSILPPNLTGEFEYTQLKARKDIHLDLRYKNPPADRICINNYKEKNSKGHLKFQLEMVD